MSQPSLRNKMVPIPLQSYVLLASGPPLPRGGHCLTFGILFNIFMLLLHIDYQYIIYSCTLFIDQNILYVIILQHAFLYSIFHLEDPHCTCVALMYNIIDYSV